VRRFSAIVLAVSCFGAAGCGPGDEQYHAQILGGRLRSLYDRWDQAGRPTDFEPTNYYYVGHTTNQYHTFTNEVHVGGKSYRCRFAIADPSRFQTPGVLAIAEGRVLLWIGEDGKIVVAPDSTKFSTR
jgi:hypothetical protein